MPEDLRGLLGVYLESMLEKGRLGHRDIETRVHRDTWWFIQVSHFVPLIQNMALRVKYAIGQIL